MNKKLISALAALALVVVALVQPFVMVRYNADGLFVLARSGADAKYQTVFHWNGK